MGDSKTVKSEDLRCFRNLQSGEVEEENRMRVNRSKYKNGLKEFPRIIKGKNTSTGVRRVSRMGCQVQW